MRLAVLLIAALLFAAPASAEDYEKGPNGGLMLDVAGIDAELLTAGNTVTINAFIPNTPKPVSHAGRRECAEGRGEESDRAGRDHHPHP
jgi:hypothetical protein